MKKVILPLLVLFTVVIQSNAQQNVVGLNLGSFLLGEVQLSYERVFENNQSLHIGIPFAFRSASASGSDWSGDYKVTGIGVIPEYRFYLSEKKEAPRGFYAGPFGVFRSITAKVEGTENGTNDAVKGKAGFNIFGGGALIGHQWLISDVFSIDLNLGAGYYSLGSSDIEVEYQDGSTEKYSGSIKLAGVIPRVGVSIGYAF